MKKWIVIVCSILIGTTVLFFLIAPSLVDRLLNPVTGPTHYPVSNEAQALHDSLIIGDWHADSLLWRRNLNTHNQHGHVDVPRLLEGNVRLQVFTAVTKSPQGQNYNSNSADTGDNISLLSRVALWPLDTWDSLLNRARFQARQLHKFAEQSEHKLAIIKSLDDLNDLLATSHKETNFMNRKVGALLGLEGAHPLEGKIENLDILYDDGYRLIGLQHFFDNDLGGSLHGQSKAGLTDFGQQVVLAAIQKNMIIDVAHSSHQVVKDVLRLVDRPIVLSHTGIHKHHPVHRNLPDELMQAIANKGGVIGVGYWSDVVGDHSPAGIARAIKTGISVVGEDHISLGSDFDGSVGTTFDTSKLAALTHELLELGLEKSTIRKVMGENMVRVLKANLSQ